MKFFRMDSDLPDWEVWDEVRAEAGADFHACVAVYMFMYAKMAQNYTEHGVQTIRISARNLRKSSKISEQKLRKILEILEKNFNFFSTFSEHFLEITYPNFLKKQRLPKRYGDGKFATDKRIQDRDLENNIKSSADISNTLEPGDQKAEPDESELRAMASQCAGIVNDRLPGGMKRTTEAQWLKAFTGIGLSADEIFPVLKYALHEKFWGPRIRNPDFFKRNFTKIQQQIGQI